jgi:hypothetical protein
LSCAQNPSISDPAKLDFFGCGHEGNGLFLHWVVREIYEELSFDTAGEQFEFVGHAIDLDHWARVSLATFLLNA